MVSAGRIRNWTCVPSQARRRSRPGSPATVCARKPAELGGEDDDRAPIAEPSSAGPKTPSPRWRTPPCRPRNSRSSRRRTRTAPPSRKPIAVADAPGHQGLPTRARPRRVTGAGGDPGCRKVALERAPEPDEELLHVGAVEAVEADQHLLELHRSVGGQDRDQRIARGDVHEGEAHERDAEHDGDRVDDPAQEGYWSICSPGFSVPCLRRSARGARRAARAKARAHSIVIVAMSL